MTDILGLVARLHRATAAGVTITGAAPGDPSTVDPDTLTIAIHRGADLAAWMRALDDGLDVLVPAQVQARAAAVGEVRRPPSGPRAGRHLRPLS